MWHTCHELQYFRNVTLQRPLPPTQMFNTSLISIYKGGGVFPSWINLHYPITIILRNSHTCYSFTYYLVLFSSQAHKKDLLGNIIQITTRSVFEGINKSVIVKVTLYK